MGKLGYKVTGVDPSPDMILIAKKHFGEIANCEFINGFSSDLKGKYQLFDYSTSFPCRPPPLVGFSE